MEVGMVGMGRMGSNMALRLLHGGHRVLIYDIIKESMTLVVEAGARGTSSLTELVEELAKPRVVWLMVPAGDTTQGVIDILSAELAPGDIVVDGGNSNYKDSARRATALAKIGVNFLDIGISGGIWGLQNGYCLMAGGDINAYQRIEPILKTLAPALKQGYGHVGPSGAGHFVKMVHNGIEYGLMQAYAEGFELMQAKLEFSLDLAQIAENWRHGSVVRSWLLDLTASALQEDPALSEVAAYVEDSGEGRWTVEESMELAVPIPVITQSVQVRFRSRQEQPFSAKFLAALRRQFGGHAVKKRNEVKK
ncbi:MAG: decarboxylating 6-phosphogluconate dehydrogenase [Chloroflexi bacterium]|nr:decarboxylating 6-phosphogluconate dehydrogenase [Chloroflexota bacterium]